jgi:DNA-binding response OmpR family regulator
MGIRILVADDDAHLLAMVEAAAEARGHSTISVGRGDEVIPKAIAERPQVIVLDLTMPSLDGRDVLSRLKRDPSTSETPVVIVTGRADEYTRDLCYDYGADEVLYKPLVLEQLVDRVERLAGRSSTAGR